MDHQGAVQRAAACGEWGRGRRGSVPASVLQRPTKTQECTEEQTHKSNLQHMMNEKHKSEMFYVVFYAYVAVQII